MTNKIEKELRPLIKDLRQVIADSKADVPKKPKGSGGTAKDLNIYQKDVKKETFYTKEELMNIFEIDTSQIQKAERQGLLVAINIYNNAWKDLRGRDGEAYAIKLSKDQAEGLKRKGYKPHTKKIYYGDNVKHWMKNRFDNKLYKSPTGGSYRRKVIKGLSKGDYKKNFDKWSEIYDTKLSKLIPDFDVSQKVENGFKEYSYKGSSKSKGLNFR